MAENEIIDMGHRRRWGRTRRALGNPECPLQDVVAAMTADIEGVCRGLPKALNKGPPLALLLKAAMGSPVQTQALIAQFKEKGLATLVSDARKLARSNDPADVATIGAKRLINRLIDQVDKRAGREERFRSNEAREHLLAEAAKTFGVYEDEVRSMLESSLRSGPIRRFKPLLPSAQRLTAQQLHSVSVVPPSPPLQGPHAR